MTMVSMGRKWIYRLASGLSAMTLAFAGLAFAPAAAYADEGDPPPDAPASGERLIAELERCLRREREWLSAQAGHLARAGEGLQRAGELIEAAQARGVDTAELEALLDSAYSQLATAQSQHDEAAGILSTHAGFDDGGEVIDREQARQTCLDARQVLQDARQALVEVRELAVEMREVVRKWWQAHRPAAAGDG